MVLWTTPAPRKLGNCLSVVVAHQIIREGVHKQQIQTIFIDLAKNIFHVFGVDHREKFLCVKQLRRNQMISFFERMEPCLVGMDSRATVHCWSCELIKLSQDVRMIPLVYVKAYVKRSKNDAAVEKKQPVSGAVCGSRPPSQRANGAG